MDTYTNRMLILQLETLTWHLWCPNKRAGSEVIKACYYIYSTLHCLSDVMMVLVETVPSPRGSGGRARVIWWHHHRKSIAATQDHSALSVKKRDWGFHCLFGWLVGWLVHLHLINFSWIIFGFKEGKNVFVLFPRPGVRFNRIKIDLSAF